MGEAAYKERLEEIELSTHDADMYDKLHNAVANEVTQHCLCVTCKCKLQVAQMHSLLQGFRSLEKERSWVRAEQGELDEHHLVDGITGNYAAKATLL